MGNTCSRKSRKSVETNLHSPEKRTKRMDERVLLSLGYLQLTKDPEKMKAFSDKFMDILSDHFVDYLLQRYVDLMRRDGNDTAMIGFSKETTAEYRMNGAEYQRKYTEKLREKGYSVAWVHRVYLSYNCKCTEPVAMDFREGTESWGDCGFAILIAPGVDFDLAPGKLCRFCYEKVCDASKNALYKY